MASPFTASMLDDLDALIRETRDALLAKQAENPPVETGVSTGEIVQAAKARALEICQDNFPQMVERIVAQRIPHVNEQDKSNPIYGLSQPMLPGFESFPVLHNVPAPRDAGGRATGPSRWVNTQLMRRGQVRREREAAERDVRGRIMALAPIRLADDLLESLHLDDQAMIIDHIIVPPDPPKE